LGYTFLQFLKIHVAVSGVLIKVLLNYCFFFNFLLLHRASSYHQSLSAVSLSLSAQHIAHTHTQTHTHTHTPPWTWYKMLTPSHIPWRRIVNDYFTNVTLAMLKCKLPDDGRRPKHVAAVLI